MAKAIFGRIWACWGLVFFTATLLIFVVPVSLTFLIPDPRGAHIFRNLTRWWMTFFLHGIGCPLTIIGRHHYDKRQQYVVTANHRSMMDVPLLTPFFPGPNKTIAKKSMANIPLFGAVYRRGAVLVDRRSDASRKQSFEKMKAVLLKDKINMAVYPEGTRNRTGQPLKSFYDGAFRLAVDCAKPIMPVVMFNTAVALPPSRVFFLWPVRLEMHLLPPVISAGKTADQLKQEVFDLMWQYFLEHSRETPA